MKILGKPHIITSTSWISNNIVFIVLCYNIRTSFKPSLNFVRIKRVNFLIPQKFNLEFVNHSHIINISHMPTLYNYKIHTHEETWFFYALTGLDSLPDQASITLRLHIWTTHIWKLFPNTYKFMQCILFHDLHLVL